uniref:Uncharacterized protein n=1 Tax=Anguilla anguilla TaxID=7936 RepID=A0A0E9WN87_ANGAN
MIRTLLHCFQKPTRQVCLLKTLLFLKQHNTVLVFTFFLSPTIYPAPRELCMYTLALHD